MRKKGNLTRLKFFEKKGEFGNQRNEFQMGHPNHAWTPIVLLLKPPLMNLLSLKKIKLFIFQFSHTLSFVRQCLENNIICSTFSFNKVTLKLNGLLNDMSFMF
jgi:hypothetical protein